MPLLSLLAAATTPVDGLADKVIRDLDLQTSLPRDHALPDISLPVPDVILWAVAGVAVAALLYAARGLFRRRFVETDDWADESQDAAARRAAHAARADDFAQRGMFVEAIHELLLEALRELRARGGDALADSRTSREILRSAGLRDQARDALRAIVHRVELTWFGDRAATLEDYQVCRDSFNALFEIKQ